MTDFPSWRRPTPHELSFVAFVEGNLQRKNLAVLAALRRGFGKRPWEAPEMFPFIVPFLTPEMPPVRQEAFFLTGSAFAQHPSKGSEAEPLNGRDNLGDAFRNSIRRPTDQTSIERRFVALLSSDREDVSEHVWRAVTFLRSKEVSIDWRQFLHDLARPSWNQVRKEWASSFWAPVRTGVSASQGKEADVEPSTSQVN